MVLPVYAALERIPDSYLEASADLGARGWRTFRSVVLPLALPGVVAGSIFTFALTLGDYITPILIGGPNSQMIGNYVYENFATNLPFAAALAVIPMAIMGAYLLIARRLERGPVTGRGTRISLAVWSVLVIAFLWIPIVIIALYAFNGSTLQGWPITSWTTHWFSVAWHDPDVRSAFELSVKVGAITTGHRAPARDDGRGRRGPLPLLRPGGRVVPARPAARAARDHHRDGTHLVLQLRRDSGPRSGRS